MSRLLLLLTLAVPLLAQRFEAGGALGYAFMAEDDNSGNRPAFGGFAGVRATDRSLVQFEYLGLRKATTYGHSQHNYLAVSWLREYGPTRVRPVFRLGFGMGPRNEVSGQHRFERTFGGLQTGFGFTIPLGERAFIRPEARLFLWGPGLALALVPTVQAGFRF
jgi:hypothetical protein